jgi:hypothetical protein
MATPFGQKSPEKAIFTLQTAKACPTIVVFVEQSDTKTYKYNRLLVRDVSQAVMANSNEIRRF